MCVRVCVYHIYVYVDIIYVYRSISLMGGVFANGLGNLVSIPSRVIPKTQKMVLDTSWEHWDGVMVSKLDERTYISEFECHWVPHSHGLVPHLGQNLK